MERNKNAFMNEISQVIADLSCPEKRWPRLNEKNATARTQIGYISRARQHKISLKNGSSQIKESFGVIILIVKVSLFHEKIRIFFYAIYMKVTSI